MELVAKKDCDLSLDFQPEKNWPLCWPAYAYNKQVIAGFSSSHFLVLNFKERNGDFLSLFCSCHPHLNWLEMGRIITQWKAPPFSWEQFFLAYGLQGDTDFLEECLKILLITPLSFQKWVVDKKVHLNYLRVLLAVRKAGLKKWDILLHVLKWVSNRDVSYSVGIKILELSVELTLIGVSLEEILKKENQDVNSIIQSMERLRKPLSAAWDQKQKNTLGKLFWPTHVNGTWKRKGDQTGVEIALWCRNQKELNNQLKNIEDMDVFQQLR